MKPLRQQKAEAAAESRRASRSIRSAVKAFGARQVGRLAVLLGLYYLRPGCAGTRPGAPEPGDPDRPRTAGAAGSSTS